MRNEIETERLTFRRLVPGDAEALTGIYGHPDVARMVASWPLPPDPDLIRSRCETFPKEEGIVGAIFRDGEMVGSMGISRESGDTFGMGYGMHPDHWGKGYASEMGRAMVDAAFARYPASRIVAGHWPDNQVSGHILRKLGFRETHIGLGWCVARQACLPAHMHEVTRSEWLAANPLRIETDRLIVRAYRAEDAASLHAIVAQEDVARMILAFPLNASFEDAARFIVNRRYRGQAQFCAGVFLKDGTLIGNVGIGGDPVSTMYFYDPSHWGKGYATEAHRAFLTWAFKWFDLDEIVADHFHDNPASGVVLKKLGFFKTGEGEGTSRARDEAEKVVEFRLKREHLRNVALA